MTAARDKHATIEEVLAAVFPVGSVWRLYRPNLLSQASTSNVPLSYLNKDLPGLKNVLKLKRRLR
jgi:hypothetical protein